MNIILSKTNIYKCVQCGQEVYRCPSNIRGKNIFCSRSCSVTFHNKLKAIPKKCLFCQMEFYPHSKNIGKYCSHKCQWNNVRKNIYQKIETGTYSSSSTEILRQYLIEKHGPKCMLCKWDKNNPITKTCPVQVEHVDGNSENNKLENLKLICPNCHSLTPTYGNLNKGHGRKIRRERYRKKLVPPKGFEPPLSSF